MSSYGTKKIVCVTSRVWTGSRSAPRRLLVREGFARPTWFTTGRPITDAQYRQISDTRFHLAQAHKRVLAHIRYRGSFIGIMLDDFESAMERARQGVLVVGPTEIAVQLAARFPDAQVFSLKGPRMASLPQLDPIERSGQLHRIDVDVLAPGAWTEVHQTMAEIIGLPSR